MTDPNQNPGACNTEVQVAIEAAKLLWREYNANDSGASVVDNLPAAARYRHEKRVTAVMALEALDPHDAATICTTVLDEISAGYPQYTAFGNMRADAEFWGDCANPAELEFYFAATLKRLGNQALGIRARKRLLVALWQSFSIAERQAFLNRVDAVGCFHKGAA